MAWAFMKRPNELERVYAAIPEGTDILVSHQPPLYHGDRTFNLDTGRVDHIGSRELLDAIERVRPRIVICGHAHGGFGRFEHQAIPIYNVSVVDESYRLVNAPTVIELAGGMEDGETFKAYLPGGASGGILPASLGDVPLEADGSFLVRLPADVPLALELLDGDGRVVARQRAPFWLRPGETRGCIGCHEDPDTSPPNVRPLAVAAEPVPLGVVPLGESSR